MNTHRHHFDRAVTVGAAALAAHVNDWEPDDAAYDLATVVISALITNPDLLHDLDAHRTARALDHIAAALTDHPDRQTVQDLADHLAGRRPDPGSPFTSSTAAAAEVVPGWRLGPVRHGRQVWALGEDCDEGYLAEGHDYRALAAINAFGREEHDGPGWALPLSGGAVVASRLWVLFHETCGCTPAEHAAHLDAMRTDLDAEDCPCPHPGLPPCDPHRFAWRTDTVPADTPGAVAVTEVAR